VALDGRAGFGDKRDKLVKNALKLCQLTRFRKPVCRGFIKYYGNIF
jgi:hypothetical protein